MHVVTRVAAVYGLAALYSERTVDMSHLEWSRSLSLRISSLDPPLALIAIGRNAHIRTLLFQGNSVRGFIASLMPVGTLFIVGPVLDVYTVNVLAYRNL